MPRATILLAKPRTLVVGSTSLAHKAAYEETLRQTLAAIAKEDPETGVVQASAPFTFRKIEQVAKRYREFEASPFQRGTALAHHLCAQAGPLVAGQKQVRVVLSVLPWRQSALLLLRHEGLSYLELAATLQMNPGSIGTLLARAQQAFRKEFGRRYGDA